MAQWHLDDAHLNVGFAVKHLMVSTVRGRFTDVQADIEIDEEAPERSSAEVRIAAASVDTGQADRDAHLRSADFFDAEQHPGLHFRSTRAERRNGNEFTLEGDLTIRGTTLPVTLTGDLEGPVTDPFGKRRAGFELKGEVDREAFGLTWNVAVEAGGVMVGKKVKLEIEGEMIAAAEAAEDAEAAG